MCDREEWISAAYDVYDGYTTRERLGAIYDAGLADRAQQDGEAVGEIVSIDDSNFISMDDDTLNDLPIGTKLYTHPSASMPNLSTIAQKKLDQMGATVHGVLVKNEAGAWAAVSDAGRVMWLDGFEVKATTAPQPADNWIKCGDLSLPTKEDFGEAGFIWVYTGWLTIERVRETDYMMNRDRYKFWMPTGLKRPNPPTEGAE